jgi:hypothetical protein
MNETVERYPLAWPSGWRRTPSAARRDGSFRESVDARGNDGAITKRERAVGMPTAVARLESQLEKLGADGPTLSTNIKLNLRGVPYADQRPVDPGAAVYFRFKARATVLACDSYRTVAANIAALAAHIDALRRIERYGVGTIEQALAGYKALPADTAANWRAVFGFSAEARPSIGELDSAFKRMAREKHPDREGGSENDMLHLNRAREYALQELAS